MFGSHSPRIFAEVFVLGGFPALASAVVYSYDDDGVLRGPGFELEDVELFTLNGKPAPFLTRKMTKAEWGSVDEQIRNHMNHLKSQRLED